MQSDLVTDDNRAMSIIRRAAIHMEGSGKGCMTPGATYETHLDLPSTLSIKVTLSDEQGASLVAQIEKHPYRIPFMDQMLHDYFQVAVAKILNGEMT